MNKSNTKLRELAQQLSTELPKLLLAKLNALDPSQVSFPLTIQVPCELDPWQWLSVNEGLCRIVWSERFNQAVSVGIGEAARVDVSTDCDISESITRCREMLNGNQTLKFFGGKSFDGSGAWKSFGQGRFVIPRLQLVGRKLTLAVMNRGDIERARQDIERVCFEPLPLELKMPTPVATKYVPDASGWDARVEDALSLIKSEAVEKIVLSRQTIFEFSEPLNPIALTQRLKNATHACFVFCFNFEGADSFVGATPERLFLREHDIFRSEVIAGTRKRGRTDDEDQQLANELLHSDKDQREHDIVRKSIRQKLHKFTEHLTVDNQASILRLAKKQHLRSDVQGKLKPNVDDGTLLARLHPTPAVGGYPTDNALPEIARIEPFNRGWYAAPIGWVGCDSAQFAVAIRSGLIESNTLSLFSGAGIVRGSEPGEEWQETENKIQDFVSILGE